MLADVLARRPCRLMAFFTAGDGGVHRTRELARAAVQAGADILELGVPFSDPIADGPVIQASAQRALAGGITPRETVALAGELRAELGVPVVLLTYMNPFLRLPVSSLADAGVEAVVIPDLSFEESAPWRETLARHGVHLVSFVAPTTPPQRLATIGKVATGFVYLVSVTGVTGVRSGVAREAEETLVRARPYFSCPLAVGFGIATAADAALLAPRADALIVGSALIQAAAEGGAEAVAERVRELRTAIDTAPISL